VHIIQAIDIIANRTVEVQVLIPMLMFGTRRMTYCIIGRSVRVYNFMNNSFFLESFKYPIEGNAVNFLA
jgi:hypothetical protein